MSTPHSFPAPTNLEQQHKRAKDLLRAARIRSFARLRCCSRLVEITDGFGVDTDDLLQQWPVSASWAEERSW